MQRKIGHQKLLSMDLRVFSSHKRTYSSVTLGVYSCLHQCAAAAVDAMQSHATQNATLFVARGATFKIMHNDVYLLTKCVALLLHAEPWAGLAAVRAHTLKLLYVHTH
eukprot:GHUV01043486.1.p2 GENE.GHUV01043486.1~~GHUV01043486.1.p2  ORF type:complete len:108 (-),score=31.00 GHUV01043486.1:220-543(-)